MYKCQTEADTIPELKQNLERLIELCDQGKFEIKDGEIIYPENIRGHTSVKKAPRDNYGK